MRKEKTKDMVGEEVNLDSCPECVAHADCIAWMEGKCTALNTVDEGCVFYCPKEKAVKEAKEAYRRLKKAGRFDLIQKYLKSLTALGVLDEELEEFERKAQELETFRDADFDALMREVPGFS